MIFHVVVPFQNEEKYLPEVLRSIAAQTRPPDRLLLVDDGSSDDSGRIAQEFAAAHPFATVVRRPQRPRDRDRLASAPELQAFESAVRSVDAPWDVVAKMDADVRLTPEVLATLERRFEEDPNLGIAGPRLSELRADGLAVRMRSRAEHVEGATKFYRRECYEQIRPIPAFLGWDTIDEIRARLRGWATASFVIASGDPLHLRPMGTVDGMLRAYRRWGECAFAYGEHPLHVLLYAVLRVRDRPRVLGSVAYVFGWAMAALRRAPRAESEVRAWARDDELRRIRIRASRLLRDTRDEESSRGPRG